MNGSSLAQLQDYSKQTHKQKNQTTTTRDKMAAQDMSKCRREGGMPGQMELGLLTEWSKVLAIIYFKGLQTAQIRKTVVNQSLGDKGADAFAVNRECKEDGIIHSCTCEAVSGP